MCENGIDMEVTQEKARIGPNYMKLVQGFVYLQPKGKYKNNNNFLDDQLNNFQPWDDVDSIYK